MPALRRRAVILEKDLGFSIANMPTMPIIRVLKTLFTKHEPLKLDKFSSLLPSISNNTLPNGFNQLLQ
jgi:hypothetical protein